MKGKSCSERKGSAGNKPKRTKGAIEQPRARWSGVATTPPRDIHRAPFPFSLPPPGCPFSQRCDILGVPGRRAGARPGATRAPIKPRIIATDRARQTKKPPPGRRARPGGAARPPGLCPLWFRWEPKSTGGTETPDPTSGGETLFGGTTGKTQNLCSSLPSLAVSTRRGLLSGWGGASCAPAAIRAAGRASGAEASAHPKTLGQPAPTLTQELDFFCFSPCFFFFFKSYFCNYNTSIPG